MANDDDSIAMDVIVTVVDTDAKTSNDARYSTAVPIPNVGDYAGIGSHTKRVVGVEYLYGDGSLRVRIEVAEEQSTSKKGSVSLGQVGRGPRRVSR